jgi:hypothetical protein
VRAVEGRHNGSAVNAAGRGGCMRDEGEESERCAQRRGRNARAHTNTRARARAHFACAEKTEQAQPLAPLILRDLKTPNDEKEEHASRRGPGVSSAAARASISPPRAGRAAGARARAAAEIDELPTLTWCTAHPSTRSCRTVPWVAKTIKNQRQKRDGNEQRWFVYGTVYGTVALPQY